MKRKLASALLSLLLLLSLSACGGGASKSADSKPADNMSMDAIMEAPQSPEGAYGGGWTVTTDEAPRAEPGAAEESGGMPTGAKVILTADVDLETKDFDEASRELERAVEELGGWFESRSLSQGGSYRRLSCVIRVPSDQFTPLLDRAGQAAHMVNRDEYSEDVSEAYYDSEARLATQRTKLERLQTLLAQAATMEDIIELENALSETELQIEYLTGSLRRYDSLVGYATVTLQLREVYRLSTDEEAPMGFGQRLGSAFSQGFQRGMDNLEDWIIALAANWMTLLLLAAAVACVVLLVRRRRRRRRNLPPPAPAPEPAEKEKTDRE